MNVENLENDDVLFDRMVDGELSAEERRRFLASLDDRADGWRRCALAFLEAQSWGREMRQMIKPPAPLANELGPSPGIPLANESAAPLLERSINPHGSWTAWLAVAAGLLVAFSIGWRMNGPAMSYIDQRMAQAPEPNVNAGDGARLPDNDAITLVVQDHQGMPRRVQVPLVEGNRLGVQFADAPQWAAPVVRQEFAKQGLDLQARRRYAPLLFEQKDRMVPMIVPVDDAVITPISRPIF